jgi:hypothetical protein
MEKALEETYDELYDAERTMWTLMDELKEDPMDADLNWHIDRLGNRICALRRKAFRLIR